MGESLGVRFKKSTCVQRWYINGEVKCFQGSHAPLALLAIIVLALCVTVIPLLSIIAVDRIQVIYSQFDVHFVMISLLFYRLLID